MLRSWTDTSSRAGRSGVEAKGRPGAGAGEARLRRMHRKNAHALRDVTFAVAGHTDPQAGPSLANFERSHCLRTPTSMRGPALETGRRRSLFYHV